MVLSATLVRLEPVQTGAAIWLSQSRANARRGEPTIKAELDSEVDSLLDEIDDVLEVNAEEFVRSFVQKGGQ